VPLEVGRNSWVTVDEADDYLAERGGAERWDALEQTQKEQALVRAYGVLAGIAWATAPDADELEAAQIEQALWELDPAVRERIDLRSLGVTSSTRGAVSDAFGKEPFWWLAPFVKRTLAAELAEITAVIGEETVERPFRVGYLTRNEDRI
jgi:hypothetical protein